ncbi:MAG TPA: sugar transferase [Gaiellaceae bacterium]|nr:sugar transferase [Gaiellaceae bacterium]
MSGEIMGAAPSARLDVTAIRRGDITAKRRLDVAAKRVLDVVVAATLLVVLLPLIVAVSMAIKAGSRGPVFFRCRRVGLGATGLKILKFRKMRDGVSGSPLTTSDDDRLTSVGRFLAKSKIDEIPQLWNVLTGDMSLVGPRPEDLRFVTLQREAYSTILTVKPGITGLTQLAFAKESEILKGTDSVDDYVERLLPQKAALDVLYAERRSVPMDLRILTWTAVAVLARRDVAVNRSTTKLGLRRRPRADAAAVGTEARA